MGFKTTSLWDRFWLRVDDSGDCWLWLGKPDNGYGKIGIGGPGKKLSRQVHRVGYELQSGKEIPETLVVDHLCKNKICVRLTHLELVPFEENSARARGGLNRVPNKRYKGLRKMSMTPEERFYSRVNKTEQCWWWTGPPNKGGYGALRFKGVQMSAHKLSYQLNIGLVPSGSVLDHLCKNKLCVNPKHLEPVTQPENVRRAVTR